MRTVSLTKESGRSSRSRAVRDVVLYGVCGGVLVTALKLTEYRFLVVEHSLEIYMGWWRRCLLDWESGWG